MVFAVLFIAMLLAAVVAYQLPLIVLAVYGVASSVTFGMYALDKSAAQQNQWRTKESTLHLCGIAGGWPGALIAQKVLHHKSRKPSFQTLLWITAALNCGVLLAGVAYASPATLATVLALLGRAA